MLEYIEYTVRVYDDGTKEWYLNGKLHREDGPAIEWASGGKSWYLNGKVHREDGPYFEGKGIAFSNFELCNLEVEKRS